jgi:arginyl-tRNA--protein-N-Asp/Glu arginylyltransferase
MFYLKREIAFVREINKEDLLVKYYYLGFYVHTCQKMRYKVINEELRKFS